MSRRPADYAGKRFESIEILALTGASSPKGLLWHYKCDCGNTGAGVGHRLKERKACPECARNAQRNKVTKHGHAKSEGKTSLYNTWASMRSRCNYTKHHSYKDYGGRGIKVCKRWDNFALFAFDVGEKPSPELQLNRIDNNGDYEPNNVEWTTARENSNNRRSSKYIEYNGKSMTARQWCEELGVPYHLVKQRLVLGWDVKTALETPYLERRLRSLFSRSKA